jgi:hypothetical protein
VIRVRDGERIAVIIVGFRDSGDTATLKVVGSSWLGASINPLLGTSVQSLAHAA